MPRSAFLEGAREVGGTKTCTGAAAKQKTAEPQGAASLSLAVLESDGRKRKGSSEEQCGLRVVRRRGEKLGTERRFGLSHDWRSIRRRVRTRGNLRLGLLPLGGDSESRREKSELAYRRGEKVSLGKREAVLRRCRSSRSAVNQLRAAYWLPAAGLPAFRMEVAAAKMRAAL